MEMKKILLFALLLFTWNSFAQIEIRDPHNGTVVNGDTLEYWCNITSLEDEWTTFEGPKFHVYNMFSGNKALRIKRYLVNVPSNWRDNLCWPPTCYNEVQNLEVNGYYTTPANNAVTVYPGSTSNDLSTNAEIKPQYYPATVGSSGLYKYVVTNQDGSEDYAEVFVRIRLFDPLSVAPVTKVAELSIAPNPAVDVVTVQAEGVSNAKVSIVDVLGNVTYTADFSGSKKINVAEFKSGVYFVTVQGSTGKGYTKKLIIK
jgi:hypothetical protein